MAAIFGQVGNAFKFYQFPNLGKEVAEELVDVVIVKRLSLIQQYRIYVVDEVAVFAQHLNDYLVDVLRLVDLVPQLGEERQVQRNAFVSH